MSSGHDFPRAAGVVVPLFSLRGAEDAGSGEILDLIPFVDWLERWHYRVVQLLPINETAPGEASPYNTLSAFAIDPTYISASRVEDVANSSAAQGWLRSSAVQRRLRRLTRSPRRQRKAAYTFKLHLLELGFEHFETSAPSQRLRRFDRFCEMNAWWLDDYALFRALKERRRWTSWETWPEKLRDRDPVMLRRVTAKLHPRMRFFRYMQWIAAEQWSAVLAHARGRRVLLKGDLSFVCGRDSADTWAHPALFDLGSSTGAPPDAFSSTGQKWGLPLYDWAGLRRGGYEWWRQRARQARELYDMFRVDHVVGLYRTYAIPVREGGTSGFVPRDQADQLTQGRELLNTILEEAGARAVIAEDLGTVPDWVRKSLAQLGIPGYKVFRWEKHEGDGFIDPRSYPSLSVATTGTHDTETLATWWQQLSADERAAVVRSLDLVNCGPSTQSSAPEWPEVHQAVLRRLYDAGSSLTILPIQDLFGWSERINTPASIDRHNWTYRLPVETEQLDHVPAIREQMQKNRDMIDRSGRHTEV